MRNDHHHVLDSKHARSVCHAHLSHQQFLLLLKKTPLTQSISLRVQMGPASAPLAVMTVAILGGRPAFSHPGKPLALWAHFCRIDGLRLILKPSECRQRNVQRKPRLDRSQEVRCYADSQPGYTRTVCTMTKTRAQKAASIDTSTKALHGAHLPPKGSNQ